MRLSYLITLPEALSNSEYKVLRRFKALQHSLSICLVDCYVFTFLFGLLEDLRRFGMDPRSINKTSKQSLQSIVHATGAETQEAGLVLKFSKARIHSGRTPELVHALL